MTSSEKGVGGTAVGGTAPGMCSYAELIDSYVDGAASGPECRQAERHLAECPECRDEARGLRALGRLLEAERLTPEPVQVDLAAAPHGAGRRIAVAAVGVAAFAGGIAAVVAGLTPQVESAGSAVATLFDFVVTIGLVGAGLLDASWRGMSTAVSSALEPAAPTLLVGGVATIGLTGLLVTLLRRGSRVRERSRR